VLILYCFKCLLLNGFVWRYFIQWEIKKGEWGGDYMWRDNEKQFKSQNNRKKSLVAQYIGNTLALTKY